MSDTHLRSQIATIEVGSRIHHLRGTQVLLDSDLALLYGVEVKVLNQAVKRNVERFPSEFRFQLDADEAASLRSQIVTLNPGRGEHSKYLPYAFIEQDVETPELEEGNQQGPLVKGEFLPYCYNSIPAKPLSSAMAKRSNVAGFFLLPHEAS